MIIRFLCRRLVVALLVLVAIVFLGYAYAHTVQWDYADRYPRLYAQLQAAERPESLAEALTAYLSDLRQGSLGTLRNGQAVAAILRDATGASLGLLAIAFSLSFPIGLGLGMLATSARRLRPARWLSVFSTVGLAMPSFYVGSLLILASVAYVMWISRNQRPLFPMAGFGWDKHVILPTLALAVRPTVQLAHVTATLLSGELHKPYVVAARSLGYSWRTIKQSTAFRNVIVPVILTTARSLRTLIADLVLVEWLFFWPGVGYFLASALIPARRTNMFSSPYFLHPELVAALLGEIALLFLVVDLLASTAARILDPRLRITVTGESVDV